MSFSQRTGLITLLYKKNDRFDTNNWRPISLLCTDYKILSKVLTNRLKTVLSSVISDSQSFGVPGRFLGSNVRTIQDIVNFCNAHKTGGAIISLYQEKAFDRVDWGYMMKVVERMNFGPSFCSWVRLPYHNIFSPVLVNGHTSHAFAVTRGVRQGCPLSPLLYIIVAQTKACAIKEFFAVDCRLRRPGAVVCLPKILVLLVVFAGCRRCCACCIFLSRRFGAAAVHSLASCIWILPTVCLGAPSIGVRAYSSFSCA